MKEIQVHLEKEAPQTLVFDRKVKSIELGGYNLSDVHDLTQKVIGMTRTIKVLAITSLTLCVMAVGMALFTTHWLLSHEASIEQLLLTGNDEYNQMRLDSLAWNSHRRQRAYIHLKEFHGLHWDEGMQDWVNHSMVNYYNKTNK